jgi:hypothetical protein
VAQILDYFFQGKSNVCINFIKKTGSAKFGTILSQTHLVRLVAIKKMPLDISFNFLLTTSCKQGDLIRRIFAVWAIF